MLMINYYQKKVWGNKIIQFSFINKSVQFIKIVGNPEKKSTWIWHEQITWGIQYNSFNKNCDYNEFDASLCGNYVKWVESKH